MQPLAHDPSDPPACTCERVPGRGGITYPAAYFLLRFGPWQLKMPEGAITGSFEDGYFYSRDGVEDLPQPTEGAELYMLFRRSEVTDYSFEGVRCKDVLSATPMRDPVEGESFTFNDGLDAIARTLTAPERQRVEFAIHVDSHTRATVEIEFLEYDCVPEP